MSPYIGATFSDDDRFLIVETPAVDTEVDDGPIVGVRVSVPVRRGWAAELSYGWSRTDVEFSVPTIEEPLGVISEDKYTFHHLGLGVRWTALPGAAWRPFLTVAPGFVRVTFDPEFFGEDLEDDVTETEIELGVGGGVVWNLREALGLRVDLRDHVRFCQEFCLDDTTLHAFELSAGAAIGL